MLHPVQGVLCVEGEETGDGRFIVAGGLTWVDPPLPLAWIVEGDQHVDGILSAPTVGTINTIMREGNTIPFTGFVDDQIEEGAELVRQLQAGSAALGTRIGLSIDPDDWEVELVDTSGEEAMLMMVASGHGQPPAFRAPLVAAAGDGEPDGTILFADSSGAVVARYTRMRIRGATCCAVAAFDGAYLELASAAAADTTTPAGSTVTVTVASGNVSTVADTTTTVTAVVVDEPPCHECDAEPLVAATAPLLPPADWFENPGFAVGDGRLVRQPTGAYACPLTVTPDGHVYGHMASWRSCHTGYADRCEPPPRSPSAYAYFNDSPLPTAEGSTVHVGQLTMGAGHASTDRRIGWRQAKAHYDGGPGAVQMADVVAGEDEFGIWFSGALRPGVTDEQVREFVACGVSGDWREVVRGAGIDLIAAAAGVPVPGFPIAAVTLVASGDGGWEGPRSEYDDGRIVALVAAGSVPQPTPWERALAAQQEQIDALNARLDRAERVTGPLRSVAAEKLVAGFRVDA